MMERIEEIGAMSILFDFYGQLLPQKQQEIFRMYHEDNYSLAEISRELEITRQAVHESVKKAEQKLQAYEGSLGLAARFHRMEDALSRADRKLGSLSSEYPEEKELQKRLSEIRSEIKAAGTGLEL